MVFHILLRNLIVAAFCLYPASLTIAGPSVDSNTWPITIVLPIKVVAGQPGTLAVLGVNGRLAPDVTVELGNDQRVTTDASGRASFTAPAIGTTLLARASGSSAAALVDSNIAKIGAETIHVGSAVSLREPFPICGTRFRGDADTNHVRLNGEPALVIAASPECLSVLPSPKSVPGPAQVTVQTPSGQWTAQTMLVSLEAAFPQPSLQPGQKGSLIVNVRGSDQRLRVAVNDPTPGVIRFVKGNTQELLTSGGQRNFIEVGIEAIRSGDFSVDALLLSSPDEVAAQRYLEAAALLANKNLQSHIHRVARQIASHPGDLDDLRRNLNDLLSETIPGDCRTLLAAARTAL